MTLAITRTHEAHAIQTGVVLIPLGERAKSPKNARETAHPEAEIEALVPAPQHKRAVQRE